jgi:hypothetical protein
MLHIYVCVCMHILSSYYEEYITTQTNSALLLYSTPIGRGTDLTDWYIYQQHTVIHHIDPDAGDRGDV